MASLVSDVSDHILQPFNWDLGAVMSTSHTTASVHDALLAVIDSVIFSVAVSNVSLKALQELRLIEQSLDKFEQTGDRERLAEVRVLFIIFSFNLINS